MNVYEKVEKLLNEQDDRPSWADEILFELKEIKHLLKELKSSRPKRREDKDRSAYFAFVKSLRKQMRADIINDIFPQVNYLDKELGINFKGHLYDKSTNKELPAHEAFAVYRFLYENRKNLDKYIIK